MSACRSSGEGGSATPASRRGRSSSSAAAQAAISTDSVADWDAARRIVQCALDSFGRIDIVVNNAGILRDVIFHKMTPQDWLAVIGVHLNGSFFVSRAAAEHFRKQESGAYVHMTSTSGLIGNFGQANYSAAKLGIYGAVEIDRARHGALQRALQLHRAVRLEPHDQLDPGGDAGAEGAASAKIKQMTPDKNAPLAVSLASDAAQDVTGQVFGVRMQRDLPVQPEPADPQHPPRRAAGRPSRSPSRRCPPSAPPDAARPQRRCDFLGPG